MSARAHLGAVVRRGAPAILAIAMLVPSTAAAGLTNARVAPASAACTATASAGAAAVELYGPSTEFVSTDVIAGMTTALVLEPRIAPGTRRRMLAADGGWCDAASGFNLAWDGAANGARTAAAFASVAATPYFDGVTIESVTNTAPGVHIVQTHARTNGVVARWVVTTDAKGVRTATWTAIEFARHPLEASIEGLTALPGANETYDRLVDGTLAEARGLPTAESARAAAAPTVPHVYTAPDGMEIRLSIGDSHVGLDPDVQVGQTQADTLANFADAISVNYKEFYDWGLRKGWESDLDPALGKQVGWVYVNDALSAYCQACVFIADDFQIHMISEINLFLTALGFTGYKNERQALELVVGHEMFHNFQNASNNPGPLGRSRGRTSSTAYSEGTARMQETLHSYSDVTFADKTLVTGGQTNPPGLSLDANHCNGWGNTDAAFAAGPFGKTYNACYFWGPWFAQNGGPALVKLVAEGIPANSALGNAEEGVKAIAAAAPAVPVADQLAFFAQASLTNRGRQLSALSGSTAPRDWGTFWFKWAPATLNRGASAAATLEAAGVMARRVTSGVTVTLSGAGLALYEVRSSADDVTTERVASGTTLEPPAAGETLWVVGVNPTAANVNATLRAA